MIAFSLGFLMEIQSGFYSLAASSGRLLSLLVSDYEVNQSRLVFLLPLVD